MSVELARREAQSARVARFAGVNPYRIPIPRRDGNARQRRLYRRWVQRFGDVGVTQAIETRRLLRQYRKAFVTFLGQPQGWGARIVATWRWCHAKVFGR